MARNQQGESQLQQEILDYGIVSDLQQLQRENPSLVTRFFADADAASLAAAIHELNSKKWQALKASAKPAGTKPASKPGKRPAFDENGDTTKAVAQILRQR